jgi:hypothetical protein
MKYRYRAVERFWTSFHRLSSAQKESARRAWDIFKENPFDPRLRTHKILRLSANYGRTVYAVEIEGDLRLLFYLDGETVVSLIIGTHDIYKR